ncbi:hypothetical protein [Paraliomyxa miuraensis]|uniref:hypothetical protein n=1 Tax=Paraliomyxa miuraensis TaxID=376150 RepID=UPI00225243B9|nr:hypothetical protein [Paraliomyxa miuraensis]MCX4245071.1 hypothetical protein [Paraliomyxa miuraensis]
MVDVSVANDIPAQSLGGSPDELSSPVGSPELELSSPESLELDPVVGSTVVPGDSVVSTLSFVVMVIAEVVVPSMDEVVPSPVPGDPSSPQAPSASEPPTTASKALKDVVLPSRMRAC